jgi:hypothetical protein
MAKSQLEQVAKQGEVVLPAKPNAKVGDRKEQVSKETGTKSRSSLLSTNAVTPQAGDRQIRKRN